MSNAQHHILIIGHREEENRFCRACAPVYTSAQLARATEVLLNQQALGPVKVTYVDAADPETFARYVDRIRAARREGLRFPLVYVDDILVLHGTAEPYAVARKLRELTGTKVEETPAQPITKG